jgi:hypothetical protein
MAKKRTMDEYRQTKDAIYTPKYNPKTGELNPEYEEGQLEIPFADVDFVNEVETFNRTFGKPNNYEPTVPEEKEWKFVYDFCIEEINEYRELHGLKDKIWPAYQEVQASNMSKSCKTQAEAKQTVAIRAEEQGEECHFEKVGDRYVVYRTRDRKVMKSIKYFRPNLKQFFTERELKNV